MGNTPDNFFAVCLLVKDLEKSLSFYKNDLGLTVESRDGGFANLKTKGASLALFQREQATSMFPKEHMGEAGAVVIGLQTNNINKLVEEKGLELFEGPKTTDWGQRVAYLKDPDGHIIELSEPFEG